MFVEIKKVIKISLNSLQDLNSSTLINTSEACRMLGISAKTLRRWCHQGFISYYNTVGGHKRFSLQTLQEFLEKNLIKSDL